MRRILTLFLSLGLLLGFAKPARAQSAVEVTNVRLDYTFGEQITFSAVITSPSPIQESYLFFQAVGDQNTHTVPLTLAADGSTNYIHRIQDGLVRPFARVYFWYHIILVSGETFESTHYYFQYDDNRYPWQTLEDDRLRVHWYAGDVTFGQAAFDAAHVGLASVETLIPAAAGEPIDIFVYASATDVQDTLGLGGYGWVAGHASPDLGVVLVSVAPGESQGIEMARQVPHELAHVLLYRMTGAAYDRLPAWLTEGVAMQVEQYPGIDYGQVLANATQNKALLPISGLCGPFPADASGAMLAYAESGSFTRYLHDTYGTSGLQALIQAYADGLSCEQGASHALGISLSRLDLDWQQAVLGANIGGVAFQNLLPYLALLAVMLIIPAWQLGLNMHKRRNALMKPKPSDPLRIHIRVTGRVQGVGFRAFVQQSGALFGLTGWVRNVGYDTVETVAEGPRERLEQFAEAVKSGPRAGRVDETRIEWETASGEFRDFGVKYSV